MSYQFNLNEKVELLHGFAYDNKNKDITDKIENNNITMEDIKFKNSKIDLIENVSTEIFKGNFKFVNFIPGTNTMIINKSGRLPLTFFISPYKKDKDASKKDNPKNNDSAISYLFSPLVINKIVPNVLLPIVNLDVKLSKVSDFLVPLVPFGNFTKKIKKGDYSNLLSVRVRENFYKGKTLENILENSTPKKKVDLKPILFQVLYTLDKLNEHYPNFRHNSLSPENIFIYKSRKSTKYKTEKSNYLLKHNNDLVKIGNFENSVVPNFFKSSTSKKIPLNGKENSYFDFHYLLNTILYKNKLNSKNIKEHKEFKQFIDRVFPKKFRGKNKNGYYLEKNAEPMKLNEILEDKYFDSLILKKSYFEVNNKSFNVNLESDNKEFLGIQSESRELFTKGKRSLNKDKKSNKKLTRKIQDGGYVDNYKPIKHNPNFSRDKRQVFKRKIEEKPKPREPPVIVEQKIYDVNKSRPSRPPPVQPFIPVNLNQVPLVNYPYKNLLNKIPIQKIYNITIGDPGVEGNIIGRVFEDMIPGDPYPLNSLSVNDRLKLRGFLRNLLIENYDGEEMNITGGKKSFRSYFKFGPFNPYSLAKTPYDDCATNFTLYSVFYPLRYDNMKHQFSVAKDANAYNLRTYNVTLGALYNDRLTGELKQNDFNVFRELNYYKYMLSEVISKKISPNFVNMYLWKTDFKTKIKYDKLLDFKLRKFPKGIRDLVYKPINKLVDVSEQIKLTRNVLLKLGIPKNKLEADKDIKEHLQKVLDDPEKKKDLQTLLRASGLNLDMIKLRNSGETEEMYNTRLEKAKRKINELTQLLSLFGIKRKELEFTAETKQSLIIMTEAPTHNILRWASPVYNTDGAKYIMVGTGYHPEHTWMSVLFQMVHSVAVLQDHAIYHRELSMEKSIFIKDIFNNVSNVGYWRYIVDDFEFFVPNYGYIVLYDSSYCDKIDRYNLSGTLDQIEFEKIHSKNEFKIVSPIFESEPNTKKDFKMNPGFNDVDEIREKIREKFRDMILPDSFIYRLKMMKGILPSDKIINLLDEMANKLNQKNYKIRDLLKEFFQEFLHNRVGSLLSKQEKDNVSLIPVRDFKTGRLVVYQERYNIYKWAIYDKSLNNNQHRIIFKNENNKFENKDIYLSALRSYPKEMKVGLQYKNGHNLNLSSLIETYKM